MTPYTDPVKVLSEALSIDAIREKFGYDPETGDIYFRSDAEKKLIGGIHRYRIISFGTKCRKPAHHVIWAMHYGYWPVEIDHRDRDKLNNRLDNLRLATRSENTANTCKSWGSSKAKGVYWESGRKSFRAHIRFHGKSIHLGYFDIEDEAAHAYNKKAIELFGEYASLNPIGVEKEVA